MTLPESGNLGSPGEPSWPNCESGAGLCPFYVMSQRLGGNTQEMLMRFIWTGEAGSRITIQKNVDGFTLQITSGVHRSDNSTLDLLRLQSLNRELEDE